jgi:hypothetical protein
MNKDTSVIDLQKRMSYAMCEGIDHIPYGQCFGNDCNSNVSMESYGP